MRGEQWTLPKAFDTVSRKILTDKLLMSEVDERAVRSAEHWLTGNARRGRPPERPPADALSPPFPPSPVSPNGRHLPPPPEAVCEFSCFEQELHATQAQAENRRQLLRERAPSRAGCAMALWR